MSQVIVVGSGIAGLITAIETSRKHTVTLITKSELSEGSTRYAQGGIAAAMFEDDSIAEHIADTLRAGAGLNRISAVKVLCSEGPARIRDLIALGVQFDQRNGELARGLEAAHSRPRVLHAGGDATGLAIESALLHAIRSANIQVLAHTFVSELLTDGERVIGVEILDAEGLRQPLYADAVVLASGGAGQLYPHTTNPSVATGDGVAIALRAGARVADVEFYQFHPTALAIPGNFLISEAVRGDGAVLLDAQGRRFMQALHQDAELAPRDIVARGIAAQMALQGETPVLLDATKLGSAFLAKRFPTIDRACRNFGLDWSKVPVPVTPAAHYWMGGIQTDEWGRTSLPGLFAVGETACTGVHGANRLASNSLLESLVFAWRCAHCLLEQASQISETSTFRAPEENSASFTIDLDESANAAPVDRKQLQQLMWHAAGIHRNGEHLQAAANQLQQWRGHGSSAASREDANLLTLARVIVAAALKRTESRGAHFRDDFPERSPALEHPFSYAKKVLVAC